MEDLTAQDTQLPNVANVEGIDVTQKLFLAQEELALEIKTLLDASRSPEQAFWLAAQPTIENVAVTPALKLWHTFRALEMVYRDAYPNQLNARYLTKANQFQERAKWAYEKLLLGIGMVWSPVPRAAVPQVVSAPGSLADGTYYVTMAWSNTRGEEGAPSVPTTISNTGGTLLVEPATPPPSASGWNVYVGQDPASMSLQNGSPIAPAQTWLQPNTVTTGGRTPGTGQLPSTMLPAPRTIMRG
jgi:hypothetical protein